MRTKCYWLVLLPLLGNALGCASNNPDVRVRRLPDGRLQVDGPLAGPYDTLEELAEKSCDIMTRQPGASNGPYGFEYCALHYYAREENAYFLSYLSDIRGSWDPLVKSCTLPNSLNDPAHSNVVLLAGHIPIQTTGSSLQET